MYTYTQSMLWISNFLLTEREVCSEKYCFLLVFSVQTEPAGRGLYKKTEVIYFSVHTEQARLIILVAWYTFGRIPMYSFFSSKNYSQINITSNNLTIFITLKITIVWQNKTKTVKREIMWADSTPGICGYFADLRITFREIFSSRLVQKQIWIRVRL
jgi:hypothetical protein